MTQNKNILKWIDNQYDTMTLLLEKWVNINSGSENISGLDSMLRTLSEDFNVLEADIKETLDLNSKTYLSKSGEKFQKQFGKALSLKKRPSAPVQVLLAGHMDTVFPKNSQFQSVQKKSKHTWMGPGAADMKGGLIIMLKALQAFEYFPFKERLGWHVLITPDEEIGSPASQEMYRIAAKGKKAALIFEPSFSDGAFVSWRKGSANFTLKVSGQSAHAGRDFHKGVNAIFAIAGAIKEIELINNKQKGITVNVGFIEGGGPVNIVPDLAMCKINIRANTSEDMFSAIQRIKEISENRPNGITFQLIEDYSRVPKPFDEKTKSLFAIVQECCRELGLPFQLRESGGVCDGNILSAEGLATFDSAGAIGGHLHTDQEYIELESLVERAKLSFLVLEELAKTVV